MEIKAQADGLVPELEDIVNLDPADFEVTKTEDEGVSICAALNFCDIRAVLLMQQTGLMDSLNNIRCVACEYEQPVCMVVGLLGKEPDRAPTASANFGVRVIQPVLDAMEIDHILIEGSGDVAQLPAAIDRAYAKSRPLVALIGRSVRS